MSQMQNRIALVSGFAWPIIAAQPATLGRFSKQFPRFHGLLLGESAKIWQMAGAKRKGCFDDHQRAASARN
jgi:hypothetical protein